MQNFDAFVQALDQSEIIARGAENVDVNSNPVTNASALSTSISLEILRQYHEWLMKQLS